MQETKKPQINAQVTDNVKLIYEIARRLGGLDTTRLVVAGLVWLLENPMDRQPALDRLEWLETDPSAPRSKMDCEAYIRRTAHLAVPVGDAEGLLAETDAKARRRGRRGKRRGDGGAA